MVPVVVGSGEAVRGSDGTAHQGVPLVGGPDPRYGPVPRRRERARKVGRNE
jgi:hypothetical protein